tara:strand:- start:284 stop:1069 length:786 start_codon:yes stop_codon:yes gene_type:complete
MTHNSAIYRGQVVHERLRPKRHRLQYNVFTLLIDLEELPKLNRLGILFGYNRPAILSFYDKDHGPTTGTALRPWVETRLREAGLELDVGTIKLLCYPRIFGYVFNPLSVYFCYRANGDLIAILYEVCNTFNERHVYVIGVDCTDYAVIKQSCKKMLYVSPFMEMSATYHFRVMPPGDRLNIAIRQEDADGLLFTAAFNGTRTSLTRGTLARCLLAFPFLTVKVIAAIHWEALLLWAKGLRVFPHTPAVRPVDSSVGQLDKN